MAPREISRSKAVAPTNTQEPPQEIMVRWIRQGIIKARTADEFEEKSELVTETLGNLGIFDAIDVQREDAENIPEETDEDDDTNEPPEGELNFDP